MVKYLETFSKDFLLHTLNEINAEQNEVKSLQDNGAGKIL